MLGLRHNVTTFEILESLFGGQLCCNYPEGAVVTSCDCPEITLQCSCYGIPGLVHLLRCLPLVTSTTTGLIDAYTTLRLAGGRCILHVAGQTNQGRIRRGLAPPVASTKLTKATNLTTWRGYVVFCVLNMLVDSAMCVLLVLHAFQLSSHNQWA